MTDLPFDQAVQRFQDNEARLNVFVNAPADEIAYQTTEGESVPTLPQLLPAVQSASAAATAGAIRAEAAADAAQLAGDVHPSIAAGLLATTPGNYFSVPSTLSSESLILYLHAAGGEAEEIKRYPSEGAVTDLRLGLAGIATGLVRTQGLMVHTHAFE